MPQKNAVQTGVTPPAEGVTYTFPGGTRSPMLLRTTLKNCNVHLRVYSLPGLMLYVTHLFCVMLGFYVVKHRLYAYIRKGVYMSRMQSRDKFISRNYVCI